MDIKKEPVSVTEEHSDCEVIDVVDLTVAAKKGAAQAMAKMRAHVSLKFILNYFSFNFLYVCLSCL